MVDVDIESKDKKRCELVGVVLSHCSCQVPLPARLGDNTNSLCTLHQHFRSNDRNSLQYGPNILERMTYGPFFFLLQGGMVSVL